MCAVITTLFFIQILETFKKFKYHRINEETNSSMLEDSVHSDPTLNALLHDTFYFSRAGYLIPISTGLISLISSFIIVYVIVKSGQNTSYHRIMLLMSISDITSSLAVSLTTLPMPTDVIYPFEGPTVGTTTTCTMQGLANFIGTLMAFFMACNLNIYYLFIIRFKMCEQRFKKSYGPILLSISTLLVLGLASFFFKLNLFNPSPYEPFCHVAYYPFSCMKNTDEDCIRGDTSFDGFEMFQTGFLCSIVFGLLFIVCTMAIIMSTFLETARNHLIHGTLPSTLRLKTKRTARELGFLSPSTVDPVEKEEAWEEEHDVTKEFRKQALMYVGAFFISWIFTSLALYINNDFIIILKLVFQPLRGFYNMCIFLYLKIYHLMQRDKDISIKNALLVTFRNPTVIPTIMISRISMLHENEDCVFEEISLPPNSDISSTPGLHPRFELYSNISIETPPVNFSHALSIGVKCATNKEESNGQTSEHERKYYGCVTKALVR